MSDELVLLALSDPSREAAYSMVLEGAGVAVEQAEGGLHALTQVERLPVAAVMCDAELNDMSGTDLWATLRADPNTTRVPFFLIGEEQPGDFGPPHDHLLVPGLSGPCMLRRMLQQLGAPAPTVPPLAEKHGIHLKGEFNVLSLFEMLGWLGEIGQSGHLMVNAAAGNAHFMYQSGQLSYGECNLQVGNEAVLQAMMHTRSEDSFAFYAQDLGSRPLPQNISEPTQSLLVSLAVELDHRTLA